jgi:curved DNA-binding protein CbpA
MPDVINPYQVLGVPDRSDIKVCQQAYRKLAFRYHPDRCKNPKKNKKMVLINQCMDFLKNPQQKAQLDNPQPVQPQYTVTYYWYSSTTSSTSAW